MMDKNEMSETLESLLAEEKNVKFAYLYGSQADGTAITESDVDVAVYLFEPGFDEELALLHHLQKRLRKNVDLLVLNRAHNIYLLDDVIHHGLLLKEHPDRFDFEIRKWQEILDFKASREHDDVA